MQHKEDLEFGLSLGPLGLEPNNRKLPLGWVSVPISDRTREAFPHVLMFSFTESGLMALMASSSSQKSYDVFLSFRGEDTRYGITSHIYTALVDKKIETYIDEESLERGNEISPALLTAIENSKISVIVFSKDYASSSWCLSELVHIHKCRRNRGQVVLPVFYEVDPSHVRKQDRGSYRDAFNEHERSSKYDAETVKEWRAALKASADISGLHYTRSNRTESVLVKEIVEIILKNLGRPVIADDDFKGLIGMGNHFEAIESLLSTGSPKLQILCIWGMPGIGKTTIANAVSSRLVPRFESYYFLKDVRDRSEKYGLEKLLSELLGKLLGYETLNSGILPSPIPGHAKDRLRRTKVLLVLDDVSERKQLEHLVGDWFGNGSKIIVTTRDEGVIRGTNIKADFGKYEVKLLSFVEALLLFSLTTFGEKTPSKGYENLSKKVVRYVGRNPLAITVFGSHLRSLRNPCKENWEMELEKLREFSHGDILKVLRISYDALGKTEQKIFLDIACFFRGTRRDFVQNILNGCNFFANTGIDDLIDKSLITVDSSTDNLNMHDLLQQMGWQIVRQESEEPGNRSRLWIAEEACHVFNNDTGTGQIEGIFLFTPTLDEDLYMNPRAFQRMNKLRLLKIYEFPLRTIHKLNLEPLECFPRSLRYLEWQKYPFKSMPSNFNMRYLVQLKLPYSQLEQLWHGTENLNNLKGIDLSHSFNLSQIPDLSRAQNLEAILLEKCTSLLQVPWHILGNLKKLSDLNLSHCRKLGSFPESIDVRELRALSLEGCVNLKTVPRIVSRSLVFLNLRETEIVNIPSSIGSINTISELVLDCCRSLVSLPSSISQLHLLKTLDLHGCSSLETFPELPMNIEKLVLSETLVKGVPSSSIQRRSLLRDIQLCRCKRLESLPTSIFELTSLVFLDLSSCCNLKNLPEISNAESNLKELCLDRSGIIHLPSSIRNLTNLRRLELNYCEDLEFIGGLCGSRLMYLSLRNCRKVQRISQLPFTLMYLDSPGCRSLEEVVITPFRQFPGETNFREVAKSFSERRMERFWDSAREIKSDTFDCSLFYGCYKLNQNAKNNILTEFQHKVLHMATQYAAPEHKVETSPAITSSYTGMDVPYWFDHQCKDPDATSSSVTIPLPAGWRSRDLLGFALCVVTPSGHVYKYTSIVCDIKFKGDSKTTACSPFIGPSTTLVFPVSFVSEVVMWYKQRDYSLYEGTEEVSFEFSIGDHSRDRSSYTELKSCGVHVLRVDDIDDLGLADANHKLPVTGVDCLDDTATADSPESSVAEIDDRVNNNAG